MPVSGSKRSAEPHNGMSKVPKTSAAAAAFFTPTSQKELVKWTDMTNLLVGHYMQPEPRAVIAAFDLDGTMVIPKSGTWPRSASDWKWLFANVKTKMTEEYQNGKRVVIISNQGGFNFKKVGAQRKDDWKIKLQNIATELAIPLSIYAAPMDDEYRKPNAGMWFKMLESNQGVDVNREESFFVGDAAGRNGDHSDADSGFARNAGIKFFVPEDYFGAEKPVSKARSMPKIAFDPMTYNNDRSIFLPADTPLIPLEPIQELVLFVGPPAVGKSTFYREHFGPAGYEWVNQDTLKSKSACQKRVKDFLGNGKSVVVDNTNPAATTRAEYLDIVAKYNASTSSHVRVRCMHFNAEIELARHNNLYRSERMKLRDTLPQIAFSSYKTRYEVPKMSEGFAEIKQIFFVFKGTEEQKANWLRKFD